MPTFDSNVIVNNHLYTYDGRVALNEIWPGNTKGASLTVNTLDYVSGSYASGIQVTAPAMTATGSGYHLAFKATMSATDLARFGLAYIGTVANGSTLTNAAFIDVFKTSVGVTRAATFYGTGELQFAPIPTARTTEVNFLSQNSTTGVIAVAPINAASVSTSTDGNGDVVVTHGVGSASAKVVVTMTGNAGNQLARVHTKTSTTFTVRVFTANTGTALATTAVTFDWIAIV